MNKPKKQRNYVIPLIVLILISLIASCTTNVAVDTASKLSYVRINDTSCLSRKEKEALDQRGNCRGIAKLERLMTQRDH